jgi:DNA modification methylase
VTPFFDDGQVKLIHGHVLDALKMIPDESVQATICSPPYWALRAYGTEAQVWPDGWRGELGHEPTPRMFVAHLVEVFREVRRVLKSDGCVFINLGDSYFGSGKGPTGHNGIGDQSVRQGFVGSQSALAYGSDGKGRSGSHQIDSAYSRLCGECLDDSENHRDRTPGTDRQQPRSQPPESRTTRGNERLDSALASPDASPPGALVSTTIESSELPQAVYSRLGSDSSSQPEKYSSAPSSQPTEDSSPADSETLTSTNGSASRGDQQARCSRCNTTLLPSSTPNVQIDNTMRAKSLALIPERFALAMQDDGWYVRSRIAWCKRAPMPESVRDRPTNAWEHIWMFTKSARYFWDADAVREAWADDRLGASGARSLPYSLGAGRDDTLGGNGKQGLGVPPATAGRNMWSYWVLGPDPSPEAHFATFPREVPRRCIAAATSERGECPRCGKSWVRVVERDNPRLSDTYQARAKTPKDRAGEGVRNDYGANAKSGLARPGWRELPPSSNRATGWAPQCDHDLPPVPSTVLDPFVGSGTTTMVARSMLRRSIGIDLSEEYLSKIALRKNAQMAMIPELEPTA